MMVRQKGPDPATLAEHGVTAEDSGAGRYRFRCDVCGAEWDFDKARRLPPYYWRCDNGCNAPRAEDAETPKPAAAQPVLSLAELPAVLTPAEAASLLRVSVTTVKDWARAGDLPGAFKVGKEWRVERDALVSHILAGSARS